MVFFPPSNCNTLSTEIPDSVTVEEFLMNEKYKRQPFARSLHPFVCGLSGRSYSALEVRERTDRLARALSKELGWNATTGSEFDKCVCTFSVNVVDYFTIGWACHRLGGLCSPANTAMNEHELAYQLKASVAKAIFTSAPNLQVALGAAKQAGIPHSRIFLFEVAKEISPDQQNSTELQTVNQLIDIGSKLPATNSIQLTRGAGKTRTAYICFSSGTSGLPKGVLLSHYNVISNIILAHSHDIPYRQYMSDAAPAEHQEKRCGILPFSHIYGMVLIGLQSFYRGDLVAVLPAFNLETFLKCIEYYKLTLLPVVPPMVIALIQNKDKLANYDLSSVKTLMCGAAPLGRETADQLQAIFPDWLIRQAYGLTESSPLCTNTPYNDIVSGSIGTLLPGVSAKIVEPKSLQELTEHGQVGELWICSPSNALGYLDNAEATAQTWLQRSDGYWLRTGDEAKVEKSPLGQEHFHIVGRSKELIKVKGHQVAPAELEALLLTHHAVDDCCVISIPDDYAGERPKAYIVKSRTVGIEENERMVKRDIQKLIESKKSNYKWIKEIEFIDVIPKSPSGKILRRILRDKDREQRKRKNSAKL